MSIAHHQVFGPINLHEFCQRGYRCRHNSESGVYLWCVRLPERSFKIRYVGQTIGRFRQRILDERGWDVSSNPQRLDRDEYAKGRIVLCDDCCLAAREYIDASYRLTWLFFIPMRQSDSPLYGTGHSRQNLFKPAESAILRQLQNDPELWSFTWNSTKRGVELHSPKYPCALEYEATILGLGHSLAG